MAKHAQTAKLERLKAERFPFLFLSTAKQTSPSTNSPRHAPINPTHAPLAKDKVRAGKKTSRMAIAKIMMAPFFRMNKSYCILFLCKVLEGEKFDYTLLV